MPLPVRKTPGTVSNWGVSGTTKTASVSGAAVGDVIVILAMTGDGNVTVGTPTTTVGSTSGFTQIANRGTGGATCEGYIWTATVTGTSGGNMTFSATASSNVAWGMYAVPYEAGSTIGDTAFKENTGNSAMDLTTTPFIANNTLVTSTNRSSIEFIVGDWTANVTAPSAGQRLESDAGTMSYVAHYTGDGSTYGVYGGHYADAGAAGAKNIGFSTVRQPTVLAVEIIGVDYVPATAAGQMGWGTMGAGDMGANFGGSSDVPVAGSDSAALTEGATIIEAAPSASDALTHTEGAAALANALAVSDTATQTEGTSVLAIALAALDTGALSENAASISAALALTDTLTLSELASVLSTLGVSDSWSLAEAAAAAQQLSVSAADAWTVAEASVVAIQQSLATSDAFNVAENAAFSATLAALEAHSLADTAAVTATMDRTDALTHSEGAAALAIALAGFDAGALDEATNLSVLLGATDTAAHSEGAVSLSAALAALEGASMSELASLAVTLAATDSWALVDVAALQQQSSTSDTATFSELAAVVNAAVAAAEAHAISEGATQIGLAAADSWLLSESALIASTLSASEAHTLSELVNAVGEQSNKSASDEATQTEDSATVAAVNLVTAADAFTLTEATTLAATLAAQDSLTLAEAASILASTGASDSSALADAALLTAVQQIAVTDAFTLSEATALTVMLEKLDAMTLTEALGLLAQAAGADVSVLSEDADNEASVRVIEAGDFFIVVEDAALYLPGGPIITHPTIIVRTVTTPRFGFDDRKAGYYSDVGPNPPLRQIRLR